MKILFLGGDKRYRYMMSDLARKHSVYQIGFSDIDNVKKLTVLDINLANYDVIVFPISGLNDKQEIKSEQGFIYLSNKLFSNLNENTLFFTGIKTKKLLELISEKQLISFLEYEEVKKVNDTLTVDRSYG